MIIPFNRPAIVANEQNNVLEVLKSHKLSGEGTFNKKCCELLKKYLQAHYVTLTPSCTSALEMAYLLLDLKPGDEVILPSFTFTSTATAVTLFGATPVFVDVDSTLNIDLQQVQKAITSKTKAICVVHYAGMSCDIDQIKALIKDKDIYLIEDAAQSIGALYKNKPLGSFGDISAFSFHETKNVVCGEGGALVINNPDLVERAEIIRDKGTNRQRFFRGEVDKYSWQDKGSSYLLGELPAAYLLAQLENISKITTQRKFLFEAYVKNLSQGPFEKPKIPEFSSHNGHIFYLLLKDGTIRENLADELKKQGISAVSHYVPLHSSVAGKKFGRAADACAKSIDYSERILRLPMYYDLTLDDLNFVCEKIKKFLS